MKLLKYKKYNEFYHKIKKITANNYVYYYQSISRKLPSQSLILIN